MYLNARAALDALLAHRCVPIINENDTIAVDEIRFGDNDQLAAMVATLVGADLLVLLTDVEGLLDADGAAHRRSYATWTKCKRLVRPHQAGGLSLGGMESKLESARRASLRGLPVVIADARDPEVLPELLAGKDVGTLVLPKGSPLASRKHWIAYTLKPRGALIVDDGAVRAVCERQSSLLPAGVLGVRGDFGAGDPVALFSTRWAGAGARSVPLRQPRCGPHRRCQGRGDRSAPGPLRRRCGGPPRRPGGALTSNRYRAHPRNARVRAGS